MSIDDVCCFGELHRAECYRTWAYRLSSYSQDSQYEILLNRQSKEAVFTTPAMVRYHGQRGPLPSWLEDAQVYVSVPRAVETV